MKKKPQKKRKRGVLRKILRWAWMLALILFLSSLLIVVLYRFVNPPVTPLMVMKAFEKKPDGSSYGIHKEWVQIKEISPHLVQAVVASEDNRFMEHNGFDIKAIQKAREDNKKGKRLKGASTISMQTAKNVFLWPQRNFLRKGLEAYFTVLIEVMWGKKRIMEVYLNVMETGQGLYGVEAACQYYFGRSALKADRHQAALIAAILPSPRRWNPTRPTPYLRERQQWILWNMNNIGPIQFDSLPSQKRDKGKSKAKKK